MEFNYREKHFTCATAVLRFHELIRFLTLIKQRVVVLFASCLCAFIAFIELG